MCTPVYPLKPATSLGIVNYFRDFARNHSSIVKPLQSLDVARRDHMEFFVESVIDMKGDLNRKTSLEISVKWLNYDKHNKWTRYADLRDNQHLHDYLT